MNRLLHLFFLVLFFIIGPRAVAQETPTLPAVWPAQTGSAGSPFKVGYTPKGVWMKWSYTTGTLTRTYYLCALISYKIVHPDTAGMTPIRTARAYWQANVTRDCIGDPELWPLFSAALDAQ